jgi:hypothetical protein
VGNDDIVDCNIERIIRDPANERNDEQGTEPTLFLGRLISVCSRRIAIQPSHRSVFFLPNLVSTCLSRGLTYCTWDSSYDSRKSCCFYGRINI